MRTIALEYHDIIGNGDFASSGFADAGAASYKLTAANFGAHLEAVARECAQRSSVGAPVTRLSVDADSPAVLFTFDDGGASAVDAAEMLDRRGWCGHFFMTTDYVGAAGFLDPAALRALHERGHIVGSHSCSHPTRMSACSIAQLRDEWRRSADVLAQILGTETRVASVPGGYFSRAVAECAAEAGIRWLFTSEPTSRTSVMDGCRVIGRYTLRRGHDATVAAALVRRASTARVRQLVAWETKKLAKRLAGRAYLRARSLVFDRSR